MLYGKQVTAPDGLKGFDCNQPISANAAAAFRAAGFRFAVRYVRRTEHHGYDFTEHEGYEILKAGLGLMLVQHVAPPEWKPTLVMGIEYGLTASLEAASAGYPFGSILWCDLEGVKVGWSHADTIAFCNSWFEKVAAHGYEPGLYVGYDAGLTASELYYKLKFKRYWSAYNLNRDSFPAVRNVQMKQGTERVLAGVRYDPDVCKADAKGDRVSFLADMEWQA